MPGINLLASLRRWRRVRATHRELMALSDTQLEDIGLTRHDIGDAVHGNIPMAGPHRS